MKAKILLSIGALLFVSACDDTSTKIYVPRSKVEFPNGVTVETGGEGRSSPPGHCPPGHHMKGWC